MIVDSEVLVHVLSNRTSLNSAFVHIIRTCKAVLSMEGWEVTISHCYREGNCAADWLANYGVTSSQRLIIFEAVPKDLHTILLEELGGLALARVVLVEAGT